MSAPIAWCSLPLMWAMHQRYNNLSWAKRTDIRNAPATGIDNVA